MSLTVRPFQKHHVSPPHEFVRAPSTSPLDLEIGCGVGWHPVAYAKAHPERTLVAIEHTREKFEKFKHRAAQHTLSNLIPVHADAVRYVTHAFESATVDRIFLLYPNPEPRAENKRWFRMPFFEELLSKLKSGGTIELATNIESYAQEAKQYATYWHLNLVSELHPQHARTHFEKKYLERGETCFDLIFQKN